MIRKVLFGSLVIMLLASLVISGCQTAAPTSKPATTSSAPATSVPATSAPPSTSKPAASSPAAIPAQSGTIKIGEIRSLTGTMGFPSKRMVDAVQYGFDEVGMQVAGKNIQLIVEDDADNAQTAVDKARKLVEQDKVNLIIGPTGGGPQMAVSDYLEKAGVLSIHTNPSPAKIILDKKKWTLQSGGAEPQLPSAMGRYAYEQLKYKKVTIITSDFTAGHDFLGAFIDEFKKLGGQVIQEQYPPLNTTDYSSYLAAIKDADACVAWLNGALGVRFLTQYEDFGLWKKMPIIAAFHGSFFNGQIVSQLPAKAAQDVLGHVAPTPYTVLLDNDFNKSFVDKFKQKFNFLPEDTSTGPYQAALEIIAALKATNGDATPDKLHDAILNLNIQGPEGPIRWDKEKASVIKDVYICKLDKVGNEYALVPVFTYKDVPPLGY